MILHVIDNLRPESGGPPTVAIEFVRQQARMGRRTAVMITNPPSKPEQRAQRLGAAVDQVAQHGEPVAGRGEADFGQEAVEGVAAALQVADEVVHSGDSATLNRPFYPGKGA